MNKIYTLLIFALFLGTSSSYAQTTSLRSIKKAAKKSIANKDYYSAWKYYEMAFRAKTNCHRDSSIFTQATDNDEALEYMYKLGDAAREFKAYSVAELAYKKVMSEANVANYPLIKYQLARVYHSQGTADASNYAKAISTYNEFIEEAGQTSKGGTVNSKQEYVVAAEKAKEDCEWAKDQKILTGFNMDSLRSVNTHQTEFAPVEHKSSMYYSALKFDELNACPDPNSEVTRLYTSDYSGDGGVTSPINWAKDEKGTFVAHTTFDSSGNRMYFTLCQRINAVEFECEIYYRDRSSGLWGDAIRLPEAVNLTGSTSTQPNIGYDDILKKELLFFVTNRADSLGGENGDMNIYCSIIEADGRVSAPSKIDVNTAEDDVTPFYNKKNKTLYFSSKGYQGFGGYDIYQAEREDGSGGFVQPSALEKPFNSSYDDYYYSSDDKGETIYFSTNRLGVVYKGEGLETCCDDIYKMEIINVKLEVTTFNTLTGDEGLDSCEVALYDVTNPNNPLLVGEKKLDPNGNFYEFPLELERDYRVKSVRGKRWSYDGDENGNINVEFTTKGLIGSQTIKKQLYHTPDIIWNVYTFVKTDDCGVPGSMVPLPDCKFDFSNELSTESLSSVESDNHFFTKLKPDDMYKTEANDTTFFLPYTNSSNIATRSTKGITTPTTFNDSLYFTLYELPLNVRLYFHNDYPKRVKGTNGRRWAENEEITDDKFDVLFSEYIGRMGEYKRKNKNMANGDSDIVVDKFFDEYVKFQFENNVDNYYNTLDRIANIYKDSDCKFQIDVLGITSPKASKSYNELLAKRRINCFNAYLKAKATGGLKNSLPIELDDKSQLFRYEYCPMGEGKGENCGYTFENSKTAEEINNAEVEQIEEDTGEKLEIADKGDLSIYGINASSKRKVVIKQIKILRKPVIR